MFVVFEGMDGVGKTTQMERLYNTLREKGHRCHATREPGGTTFGEEIRHLFKMPSEPHGALSDLYLVLAARAHHVSSVIQPKLQSGNLVLCDRFVDSTYVYQSILGGIPKQTVDSLLLPAMGSLCPTITFVFLCPGDVAYERVQKNRSGGARDRFDGGQLRHYEFLGKAYDTILAENYPYPSGVVPKRVVVDATQSPQEIADFIFNLVDKCTP